MLSTERITPPRPLARLIKRAAQQDPNSEPGAAHDPPTAFDIDRWITAISHADLPALRTLATSDMTIESLAPRSPLHGTIRLEDFGELLTILSQQTDHTITLTITELTAQHDRIAIECHSTAQLADGSTINETHLAILYHRNGKAYHMRHHAESELIETIFGSLAPRRKPPTRPVATAKRTPTSVRR